MPHIVVLDSDLDDRQVRIEAPQVVCIRRDNPVLTFASGKNDRCVDYVAATHRGEHDTYGQRLPHIKPRDLNVLAAEQNPESMLPWRPTPGLRQSTSGYGNGSGDALEMIEQGQHLLTRTFESNQRAGVERDAR